VASIAEISAEPNFVKSEKEGVLSLITIDVLFPFYIYVGEAVAVVITGIPVPVAPAAGAPVQLVTSRIEGELELFAE
jgi:hypothetical protein